MKVTLQNVAATLLAGLAAGVSAAEQHYQPAKRDITYVTLTDVVWEIVTVTVYGDRDTQSVQTTTLDAISANVAVVAATTTAPIAPLVNVPPQVAPPATHTPISTTLIAAVAAPTNAARAAPAAPAAPAPAYVAPAAAPAAAAAAPAVAAAPAAPAQDTSASTGAYAGQGTFYELGLVACGQWYTDADKVAAISYKLFDQNGTPNPNNNPHCGQRIRVYRGAKHVDVAVVDRCAGCEGTYDVDLSPSAFDEIADQSEGRVQITWSYL